MKTMTVEHASGESAYSHHGHTFATVAEAISYLERNGGGTIEIETIDNTEDKRSDAQILTEDYHGESLIVVSGTSH